MESETNVAVPSTGAQPSRLSPVAALERHTPSRRVLLDTGPQVDAVTRYGYRLGDLGILLGVRLPCEVVPPFTPTHIPGSPRWFSGVINLRGSLVPVFDLRALFDLTSSTSVLKTPTGLILDRGDYAAAVIADGHPRPLKNMTPLSELPPMPDVLEPFVNTAYTQDREVWLELDHRKFFASIAARMGGSAETGAGGTT
jgi:twitching motility protein PilI